MAHHEGSDRGELARGTTGGMPVQYYPEDEVSLFDLWDVLIRRWRWVAGVLLVAILLGVPYALTRVEIYEYTYTIDVGERLADGDVKPIASPEGSAAKLDNNYIPAAVREYLDKNPEVEWQPKLSASAHSAAAIVILRAEGALDRREPLVAIMEGAAQRLEQDHARRVNAFREQLEAESKRAETRIEALEREIERLQIQIARVEEREEGFTTEIEDLERRLTNARGSEQTGDSGHALSYLMLVDRLRDARGSLDNLQFDLRSRIEESRQEREQIRGELNILETRQRNLTETSVLSDPQQSLQPVGTGKRVIVALSVVLGGMLGVFAAFFVEFVHAANRRRREGEGKE